MSERLHKRLAQAGIASRRQAEAWIEEGRIKVNGQPAQIGQTYTPGDKVSVDGRFVNLEKAADQPTRVILYKKKVGEVVTRDDPEGRPTIFRRLPRLAAGRWIAIGRLDINTSGLLLLTNDGELARRLMHPSYEVEREYAVRVHGEVSNEMLQTLRTGVELDDGQACFTDIKAAGGKDDDRSNHWFHVTLTEGRNREVRRLWESQGVEVSRLMRVRYGPIALTGGIKAGTAVEVPREGLKALCATVDYKPVVSRSRTPLVPGEGRATRPSRRHSGSAEKPDTPWGRGKRKR